MPWNSIENPIPGGVIEDLWDREFTSQNVSTFTNTDGSPYILVNYTNPKEWDHPPNYGGTAYALQCAPNPNTLGNVTDNCAQLGTFARVHASDSDVCSLDQLQLGDNGDPCAIKPDEAMVSSISSVVESLSASQSLATAAPTTTESPASSNAAVATGASVQPALAAALVLGGWELWSL
ncbi:unnamed protein product [Alternaria alternata]